jgi:hypothetical protein
MYGILFIMIHMSSLTLYMTRLPKEGESNILVTSALPYCNNVPHLGGFFLVLGVRCF